MPDFAVSVDGDGLDAVVGEDVFPLPAPAAVEAALGGMTERTAGMEVGEGGGMGGDVEGNDGLPCI